MQEEPGTQLTGHSPTGKGNDFCRSVQPHGQGCVAVPVTDQGAGTVVLEERDTALFWYRTCSGCREKPAWVARLPWRHAIHCGKV